MRARLVKATWPIREAVGLPLPGDVLDGKYRIGAEIARGGMAAIFAAEHLVLGQRVAVKVTLPELADCPSSSDWLLLEARATARLSTAHTVRVFDAGVLEGRLPYLVMEYLEGTDVAELKALRGSLPAAEVADLVLQALLGLAHAHAAGIVHRDLKPANLFLARTGDGGEVVKLLDFGVSTGPFDDDASPSRDELMGSPSYMSPEHVRTPRLVNEQSDIWAIGVTIYELVTGVAPFDSGSLEETFAAILSRAPRSPRALNPEVPEQLSRVVRRCLQVDPRDRYGDVAELARALAPCGTGRWSHLVDAIEGALDSAAPRSAPRLVRSLGPGDEARRPIDALASTVPPPGVTVRPAEEPPPRRRRWPGQIALAVCAAALVSLTVAVSCRLVARAEGGSVVNEIDARSARAGLSSPDP